VLGVKSKHHGHLTDLATNAAPRQISQNGKNYDWTFKALKSISFNALYAAIVHLHPNVRCVHFWQFSREISHEPQMFTIWKRSSMNVKLHAQVWNFTSFMHRASLTMALGSELSWLHTRSRRSVCSNCNVKC
jgi:hypothetical protein